MTTLIQFNVGEDDATWCPPGQYVVEIEGFATATMRYRTDPSDMWSSPIDAVVLKKVVD